ncbi:taste receptor type 2 member 14-like [Lepus europaeus]|uniref:taste receptor type 2 member 14-like n=1 Tax=Lepus europaeus TaxID=9983 RepID=UPI002B487CB5|nr:taste receptor type 2 member 14-like [Lepus europaeus]
MGSIVLSIIIIILGVELVIGNLGNGFIALVNIIDWVNRTKISSVDQLLTALAISRIALLWVTFLNQLLSVLSPTVFWSVEIMKMANIIWLASNHFQMWLATDLSIFYFLKIANFSNSTFHYLKWRVEKVISGTLLVSLVLLFLSIDLINTHTDFSIVEYTRTTTVNSSSNESLYSPKHFLLSYMMITTIPFIISLTAFLLLIFSLWRHLQKMQFSSIGSRDASTEAHLRGVQSVVAFLLLYAVFFLFLVMQLFIYWLQHEVVITMLCHVFTLAFPSGHTCVLILQNKKLRQASLSALRCLKCSFKGAETSFPSTS